MKKIFYLIFSFTFFLHSFSFGQDSGFARDGEGVYAFLKRNNRPGEDNYEKFIQLNQGKLGKNQSLKLGIAYLLPPPGENNETTRNESSNKRTEPLFGDERARYTIKSDRLKGTCFFLSSGHGGPDPGAVTTIDGVELHEDEYAYDVTLRLALNLLEEGATVHVIIQDAKDGIRDDEYLANSKRETCMGAEIPLDRKKRLQQRCDKINRLSRKSKEKYQRAVFIHLDSRPKNQPVDIFFYHWEKSAKGKTLANTLRKTIHEKYNQSQPNRGFDGKVSSRDLYVLHQANPVGVFVELGNIQSDGRDRKRFLDKNNRQAVANWLCEGLIKDYQENK